MPSTLLDRLKQEYKDKRVLVVGLGLQGGGLGIAQFFAELNADVRVTDLKSAAELAPSLALLKEYPIKYSLGKHKIEDFIKADLIFKTPKMRWDSPEIQTALSKGVKVEMEAAFFASLCPAPMIGVTGTRGKTTTASLIYEILHQQGYTAYLAGNIPQVSTINLLKQVNPHDYVVLELSSWQLSGFRHDKRSPHIAVFTNFYPDHLDYYHNMDEYYADKAAIYQYQTADDYAVINKQLHPRISANANAHMQFFTAADFPEKLIYLRGQHNRENAAAAYQVSQILGLNPDKSRTTIKNFRGVPNRQEHLGEKDGAIFINDTTATTPTATLKAIETFSDKPLYLIFGGNTKHLPTDALISAFSQPKRIILLAGSLTEALLPALKAQYPDKITAVYTDLDAAVKSAFVLARQETDGAYIVLSPGATSFAMFDNEFHRGDEYRRIVTHLLT